MIRAAASTQTLCFYMTRKMRTLLLISATLFIFTLQPTRALACTCPRESSLRAFQRLRHDVDVIFVGKAIGSTVKGGMNFIVERIWKGKLKRQAFVYTAQDSSCSVGFADGERYLVFAFAYADDGGALDTNLCLRPGRVRDRRAYIKRLGKGRMASR